MAKESTFGRTGLSTMVNGKITKFLDLASTNGLMEEGTRENGLTTICTEEVCIRGKMEGNMMENTSLIKNMGTEFIIGLMEEGTRGTGSMANNMEGENIIYLTTL